jgi:hypothetical protein
MSDRPKKPEKKAASKPVPKASSRSSDQVVLPLSAYESLADAVESFVRSNSNFESSTVNDGVIADLKKCTDLNVLFLLPLQRRIFSMSSALTWVLFVKSMPVSVGDEDMPPFSEQVQFSADNALEMLAKVYDQGMEETIWEHFADDESEDEDEGEDEDEDEE